MTVFMGPSPQTAEISSQFSDELRTEEMFDDSLTGHIRRAWELARNAKLPITERLLRCERQRRGVYDPDRAQEIQMTGGSDIFMMITDIKCRAAQSWIKDVMANVPGRPFDLEPAKDPEIPPETAASISDLVRAEATQFLEQGLAIHPETYRVRMREVHQEVMLRVRDEAKAAAKGMANVIEDQFKEGGWEQTFNDFLNDYVTYPTAVIKAPSVKRKKRLTWGPDFTPVVINDYTRAIERVSPYDIYPGPNSIGPQSHYILERHRFHRSDLEEMIGVPGFNSKNLERAIDHYGMHGLRYLENGDQAHNLLEGKYNTYLNHGETIETMEYWGKIRGKVLMDWGMRSSLIEPYKDYEVNAWICGSYIIRCVLNPDPLGRRPYSTASWGTIPHAFWGTALPEIMRDVQIMCNASARSLANNMSVASGPQVEVVIDRLPDGEDLTAIYPWKIWQTTTDRTGGGQPAVKFFQPQMNAAELMGIYQAFSKQADEITGIPNYVYGSTQVGGAGRTASGLSMLMDNASKGIKMAVIAIDQIIGNIVDRYYAHNMIYHPDPYIKGDFKIVSRGAMGLIAKEQVMAKRAEFLQSTANPIDMEIIGLPGRAGILREVADGLNLNTDKIVPPEEMLKNKGLLSPEMQKMQQEVAQAQEAMQQLQQGIMEREQKLAKLAADNEAEMARVAAMRYQADRRAEADKYRADRMVDAQQIESEAYVKQGEERKEPVEREPQIDIEKILERLQSTNQAPIIINPDNSEIAAAIGEQAKTNAELGDKLAKAQELIAKAIEKTGGKKSTIKITRGPDGSLTGQKTEE